MALAPNTLPLALQMSHTVVRGKPNAAQLHLDTILDDILTARGIEPGPAARDTVTLSEILYHCLKERPNDLFMVRINSLHMKYVSIRRFLSNLEVLNGKIQCFYTTSFDYIELQKINKEHKL